MVLNPLGLTEALVELDSKGKAQLTVQGKKSEIKKSPVFRQWITEQSLEEVWFISGRRSFVDDKYITKDSDATESYERGTRMIQCENIRPSNQDPFKRSLRRCYLQDASFELRINFTSLSC